MCCTSCNCIRRNARRTRLRKQAWEPRTNPAPAIVFATGILAGTVNVLMISIVQRGVSAEFRGRVLGLHTMMIRVLVPIGMVGGGAIADLTGRNVPVVYAVCGTLALMSVTLIAARPATRAFLASA